jgi:hypothetical protein
MDYDTKLTTNGTDWPERIFLWIAENHNGLLDLSNITGIDLNAITDDAYNKTIQRLDLSKLETIIIDNPMVDARNWDQDGRLGWDSDVSGLSFDLRVGIYVEEMLNGNPAILRLQPLIPMVK